MQSRDYTASILGHAITRSHLSAPPNSGRLRRQSAKSEPQPGQKSAQRPFRMEAKARSGVEWANRQARTWDFPELETAANEGGLHT